MEEKLANGAHMIEFYSMYRFQSIDNQNILQ